MNNKKKINKGLKNNKKIENKKPKAKKVFVNETVKNIELSKREKTRLQTISNLIFLTFLVAFSAVIIRVFTIEVFHNVNGVNLKDLSSEQYQKENSLKSERGTIYDSNGEALTINIKQYKMYAVLNPENTKYNTETFTYDSYYVNNPNQEANKIIEILGYENDEKAKKMIIDQLNQDPKTHSQVEFSKYGDNISIMQKQKLEEAKLPGLYFEEKENRYYPYGEFASYIIGYARQKQEEDGSVSIVGEMGIEALLDSYLKGQDGEVVQKTDKQNVPIGEEQVITPKVNGTDVYLTLDSTVNAYVHDYMLEELKGQGFDSAATVVMDADTGAILGAEKVNGFDPNKKDIEDYTDPFFQNCFEPGSTIKTLLVASSIIEGKWDPDKKSPTGKRVNSSWGDDNYIADWLYNEERQSWGSITWAQGFYFSSNVVMTYILDNLGYDTWEDYAKNVWELGVPIENDLYTSNACSYEPKYSFETATTSFGQGMTTSIMQILRAYSVFSGDGKMVNPYIVKSINDSDTGKEVYNGSEDKPKNWENNKKVSFNKELGVWQKDVMSEEQNNEVLKLLEGGATYNEGGWFASTGRRYGEATENKIGVKTGTAQVAINGNYENSQTIASVAAVAPVDDPEIIVYTYVVRPTTPTPQTYMSQYLGKIIDNTLEYLKTSTNELKDYNPKEKNYISIKNYVGLKQSEAKKDLKENKIKYEIIGKGNIVGQYPMGGTKINKNQKVTLVGKDVDINSFTGKSKDYIQNFCTASTNECVYEGDGNKVSKVTNSSKKYIVTLK